MFNPKERLQQIRRAKILKQQTNSFLAENDNPVPLFNDHKSSAEINQDVISRLNALQSTVSQLSSQLNNSQSLVQTLRRQKNELQTKVLKLEYENSQLKASQAYSQSPKQQESPKIYKQSKKERPVKGEGLGDLREIRRVDSLAEKEVSYMSQVEQALEQIKKQPLQSLLKRKQQNFRALKTDSRQMSIGNKILKELSSICKDYSRSLKKPVLVIKLNSNDFE